MAVHEDGVTCVDCWGIVPQEGTMYVKEDGELCTCWDNQYPGSYGIKAVDPTTPGACVCGACGRAWADDITPAGRCPWEALHAEEEEPEHDEDYEALHEEAREYARGQMPADVAWDEDLAEALVDAYMAGAKR